jgi:hypothetical protein
MLNIYAIIIHSYSNVTLKYIYHVPISECREIIILKQRATNEDVKHIVNEISIVYDNTGNSYPKGQSLDI